MSMTMTKDARDLMTDLAKSHQALLNELKVTIRSLGGCDHSVGLCICNLEQLHTDATDMQHKVDFVLTGQPQSGTVVMQTKGPQGTFVQE